MYFRKAGNTQKIVSMSGAQTQNYILGSFRTLWKKKVSKGFMLTIRDQ